MHINKQIPFTKKHPHAHIKKIIVIIENIFRNTNTKNIFGNSQDNLETTILQLIIKIMSAWGVILVTPPLSTTGSSKGVNE